jgi:pimeloyl-ACP methyl ester carboxylesterase
MQRVYFISGLGADKRIFSFLDLSFCEPVFIDWIAPLPKESLENYSIRLREQITDEHPTVVGMSMGGMIATEMAKHDPEIRAIIIASNKSSAEFPPRFRIGKWLPLYKWIPGSWSKRFMFLSSKWILGAKGAEQKKLLRQITSETDMRFSRWAIDAILRWRNSTAPPNVVHIHGTADRVLPFRRVKADYVIPGGTHVMTLDEHEAISSILKKLIF